MYRTGTSRRTLELKCKGVYLWVIGRHQEQRKGLTEKERLGEECRVETSQQSTYNMERMLQRGHNKILGYSKGTSYTTQTDLALTFCSL
jgi:hypothetical protein